MNQTTAFEPPATATGRMRQAMAAAFAALGERLTAVSAGEQPRPIEMGASPDSPLVMLKDLFGLNGTEQTLLLIAAAAELEPRISDQIRAICGSERPDAGLALALTAEEGWEALCPEAPLRRWRLVELHGSGPMLRRSLVLDERITHFLMGINYCDARLEGLVRLIEPSRRIGEREGAAASAIAAAWDGVRGPLPVVLLASPDRIANREVAAHAARDLRLRLLAIDAADIPADPVARHGFAVLLERELVLSGAAALLEISDAAVAPQAQRLADSLRGPTILAGGDPPLPARSPRRRIDLAAPDRAERRAVWQDSLGVQAHALGPGLDRLAEQFALDRGGIAATVESAVNGAPVPAEKLLGRLWQGARVQGRRHLDSLASRIESRATWDDLVLPPEPMAQLRDLAGHVRESWRVHQEWGWAAKGDRGLGAAALFAGASGTGKTLAAEVLAGELQLDLYRIDLSQVISKYIGETEKNLARIFTAAEDGGAILLFDEADALFGKRSEVKDSHDRYANVEVSYLLQQMEAYRGLAILTTNLKSAVDTAFLRRLRYVVNFPFPDSAARAAIWARIFPPQTPLDGVEPAQLAKLSITGGAIRSIALNAAFLAAADAKSVKPGHILTAARREYAKLEKPFTQAEQGAFR
jgi:vesicle-fusing ATPase